MATAAEVLAALFSHEHVRARCSNPSTIRKFREIIARLRAQARPGSATGHYASKSLTVAVTASVREADDTELGRVVASAHNRGRDASKTRDAWKRFTFEGQVTGRLQHPGIVPVYGLGFHEGRPYYAMRLVGRSTFAEDIESFHDNKPTKDPPNKNVPGSAIFSINSGPCATPWTTPTNKASCIAT